MTCQRTQWVHYLWVASLPGLPCTRVCTETKYLGVSDHVKLQILLQLVLVVRVEQEVLLVPGKGLEGLVGGPEESDRGVDGIRDDAQQTSILKHRVSHMLSQGQWQGLKAAGVPLRVHPMAQPETRSPHSSHGTLLFFPFSFIGPTFL